MKSPEAAAGKKGAEVGRKRSSCRSRRTGGCARAREEGRDESIGGLLGNDEEKRLGGTQWIWKSTVWKDRCTGINRR